MKKLTQLLMLGLVAAMLLAVPALAQEPSASPAAAAAPQEDPEAKAALYKKVTDNYKTNQPVAYEAAKEYLQKYPNDDPAIINYLKTFVEKYEKGSRQKAFDTAFAEKKWPEAYALGKQIAAEKPDDLTTNLKISWAGLQLAQTGNNANNAEAGGFSQKTIQLIESGKVPEEGKPYAEKNEHLGWLSYSLYLYNSKNNKSDDALGYLIKSAQYDSPIKNNPDTYLKMAAIYEANYEKMRQDYTTRFPDGSADSPEKKATLENVKQALDPLIDAIARVIAYSGTDPKTQATRDELKKSLTDYYTYRHGSTEGLDALIANIKSKPLQQPGAANGTTMGAMPTDTNNASGVKTGATTPATTTPSNSTAPATNTKPMATPSPTPNKTPATNAKPANGTTPVSKTQSKTTSKKAGTVRASVSSNRPRRSH